MSRRFVKVYRPEHTNPAIGCATLHLELRMWLLAMDRMQRGGHAPLGSGELQAILTNEKGEPYSAGRYRQARLSLIKAGQLAPSASARCLLVPHGVASLDARSVRKREECATHGHNIAWDDAQEDWMFGTMEEAQQWEAECDNIARRGGAFASAAWARGVRNRLSRGVNGVTTSAA
ncbi:MULTISPECIES: hypothetical protein [Streptomyces]|uniref:hypothetical protein n=1 Tax=Streptomyces TaxID=1883 RepID=UPI00163CDB9A|nr:MULTISPECIES: hypothetical protein [Streptomyces]MBC2873973.1 hypothetical protein [Streptomyces sp. TYQ1024]UBI39086.1 hypothetical protein K7I03_23280 [Streptomyces mobaraensis]UKW31664.1 hypothetical protein MCU78_23225 [Streptomyces sp. TYQ1024]